MNPTPEQLAYTAALACATSARMRGDLRTATAFDAMAARYGADHERLHNPEPYRPVWCERHGIEGTTVDCLRGVCDDDA